MDFKLGPKMQIAAVIIFLVLILSALVSSLYPWLIELYSGRANEQIIKFILLLTIVIGLVFVAAKRITRNERKVGVKQEDEEGNTKEKITGDTTLDLERLGKMMEYIFHLLPLYFPLLIGKIDLFSPFKVVLIGFAIVAYLLVELQNTIYLILKIADFIPNKFDIKNESVRILLKFFSLLIFFPLAFYTGFKLIEFYVNFSINR